MKRMQTLGLVGVLTSSTLAVAVGAETDVLNNWRQAITTNDFKKTLTDMKALQEEWPAVHSIKHVINKDTEKARLQTDYRNVAKTFWQGLEHYEKELREMSPEAFCTGADALLDVRERFLKHPSYINCFIVDTINRVIYVNLGERLIKVGDLPTCYDRIVKRLAESRCDWSLMLELANGEFGVNPLSKAEIQKLSQKDKVKAIEKMIGQEQTFLVVPHDFYNAYGQRILEKRSSEAWLARLAMSDHVIGAFLPALLSYRQKNSHFTPMDTFEQIRSVFQDDTRLAPTLLYGDPRSLAIEVSNFLRGVRSENWRQQLLFSDPPSFTKERIDWAEEQEAEREAQREANQAK